MDRRGIKSEASSIANNTEVWLLIIVIIVLVAFVNDKFLTASNTIDVLRQVYMVAIYALGMSFVALGGEIDLSSGTAATFVGCNAVLLITRLGVPLVPAIPLAVLLGVVVGMTSGYIVTFRKISPLTGMLGVRYIIQGLILITTDSMPVTGLPRGFLSLGRGYVANIIPTPVIIMLMFLTIGTFLLKYIIFGRSVIAVGGNAEAAAFSDLKIVQIKVLMSTICGFYSAYIGTVITARLSSGQPSPGSDMALQALATVHIGGTFKGNMLNILAGVLTWGFVSNGLSLLGVNAYWQKTVLGAVIVVAVLFDSTRAKTSTVK